MRAASVGVRNDGESSAARDEDWPRTVAAFEVMSPSTGGDDHGLKWLSYRTIESLRHYLVNARHQRLIHLHNRAGDIGRERFVGAGSITPDDPPVTLELEAVYAATDIAA